MKQRFLIGLVLSSLAVLLLSACGGKKELPQAQQAVSSWDGNNYVPEEGASLKFWFDNEDYIIPVIEEWNKLYPNVPVDYEVVGTVDARAKLTLDGPAGIGADVFIQPHDAVLPAYDDGLLLPMGEYSQRIEANYNEQAAKISMIEGRQYGIPFSIENIALFWNKDLYGEEPPKTWDDIVKFAKTYNDPASNKWAIRWEVNNSYMDYFFLTAYGFRLFGPNNNDADNPGWDSPEVAEGLNYFSSLRGIFNVAAEDATGEFTVAEFAKNTVPLTITGPWSIQDFKNAGVNFGVTKIPMLPGNRQPIVFSGAQMIHVSSYTKFPNAARRFAMFLAEKQSLSLLYNVTGKLPAINDLAQIPGVQDDPYLKGIGEQAPFSHPMPTIPEMAFAWEPQRELFFYTWNGELSPEQAAAKAMEDYQAQRDSVKK